MSMLLPNLAVAHVVVSEVMADAKGKESGQGSPGDRNEYVELYNPDSAAVDVNGWVLWDGDAYDLIEAWTDTNLVDPHVIINTTMMGAGRYAVILDPEYTSWGDSAYYQPYEFPPGTVILTVGNSTLGDGLSSSDPISLGTPDTTWVDTYGTPQDTTDSIPFGAGDGTSMERIDLSLPDREDNWAPCKDSMGTPGGENSVTGLLEGNAVPKGSSGFLLCAVPNPFLSETTIVVEVQRNRNSLMLRRCIYDVSGRCVRDFGSLAADSGLEVSWDGLLSGGSPALAGVYFFTATVGSDSRTLSLVKLR
jgi:hypothetical protein